MNPTRAKLSAGSVGFVPLGLPGRKTSAVLGDHRNSESFGIAQPHPGSTISTPKPKPCPQGAHPDTSGHFQRYFPAQPIPVTPLALGAGFGICHGQGLLLPRSLRRKHRLGPLPAAHVPKKLAKPWGSCRESQSSVKAGMGQWLQRSWKNPGGDIPEPQEFGLSHK